MRYWMVEGRAAAATPGKRARGGRRLRPALRLPAGAVLRASAPIRSGSEAVYALANTAIGGGGQVKALPWLSFGGSTESSGAEGARHRRRAVDRGRFTPAEAPGLGGQPRRSCATRATARGELPPAAGQPSARRPLCRGVQKFDGPGGRALLVRPGRGRPAAVRAAASRPSGARVSRARLAGARRHGAGAVLPAADAWAVRTTCEASAGSASATRTFCCCRPNTGGRSSRPWTAPSSTTRARWRRGPSGLSLDDLETDYGIGFRFGTKNGVFLRVEGAFGSRDGKHFIMRLGMSSSEAAPRVNERVGSVSLEQRLIARAPLGRSHLTQWVRIRIRQVSSSSRLLAVCVLGAAVVAGTGMRGASPRFFPDDPLQVDDDRALDASGVMPIEGSNGYDFAEHTFPEAGRQARRPGGQRQHHRRSARLQLVHQSHRPACDDRGRDRARSQSARRGWTSTAWPVVQEKSSGITPGYRITDPTGHLYQVKFDPPEHPGDGERRRGDWRGDLSRRRLQRGAGLRGGRRPGAHRHLGQARPPWTCRAAAAACSAKTSTGCCRERRGCPTASTARR